MSALKKTSPLAEMNIDQLMMPLLENLGFWARSVHEVMMALNPQRLQQLASEGALKSYLLRQQESLQNEARTLEKDWRMKNPLPTDATFSSRAAWINQSKLAAREILLDEIRRSCEVLESE